MPLSKLPSALSTCWEQLTFNGCVCSCETVCKNISPSWKLIKCDSSSMFWSNDDRWLTIVVIVLHVGSNIHFDRLTFTAICRYSNTVKRFFAFFKRWLDLQAPLALQMLSITFYFTFSVWVHLEKTSQRRHLFQHQQGGYLHLAPCSGDCSSPLENLDWILWHDPQSTRREKSEFRWKNIKMICLTE